MSGGFLFLFALLLSFEARRLAVWGAMGPQEGFFPLVLSILLGCFGLIVFLKAWFAAPTVAVPNILGPRRDKLLAYVISFLLFGLVLNWFGYTLTMILYLIFILRFVEKGTWKSTALVAASSVVICYLLFVRFLGIPLPEGVLTPLANFLRELGMKGSL